MGTQHIHVHLHLDDLNNLSDTLQESLRQLGLIITREGTRMSEAADQLTAAVQNVQTSFDTLNTTLQTEMQEIATALGSAPTDQALRDAAADAVTRLGNLATNIADMNTQVQGIIP